MNARMGRRIGLIAGLAALLTLAACSSDDVTPEADESLGKQLLAAAKCNGDNKMTCPGAAMSTDKLVNMQATRGDFEQGKSYAVADFAGKPTMVALLQGW